MLKKIVVIAVVLITFFVFGFYLYNNPDLLDTLFSLSPLTMIGLTIGYSLMTLINSLILYWSLHFVGHRISLLENIQLTGYTSIVNFFGPLQSGPGFRALYLKKKHSVKIKSFMVTLAIFYLFFAAFNGVVILAAFLIQYSSTLVYSLTIAGGIILIATGYLAVKKHAKLRDLASRIKVTDRNFWLIGMSALISILITGFIYHIELIHIDSNVHVLQSLVYTAAANFALFVSLTPGAIGFRESFILLSQQIHEIDTTTIIGASVIDRAFYIIFLLVLFVILLIVNSKQNLPVFDKIRK